MRKLRRVVLCVLTFALLAAPAQGATTLGQTFEPTSKNMNGTNVDFLPKHVPE